MKVETEVAGSIWKILKAVGDAVNVGDEIVIVESMKMEIPVEAPAAGKITSITVAEGDSVDEGQVLLEISS